MKRRKTEFSRKGGGPQGKDTLGKDVSIMIGKTSGEGFGRPRTGVAAQGGAIKDWGERGGEKKKQRRKSGGRWVV